MATSFQECIAMDLKFYREKNLPYLLDHVTNLSVTCFLESKEPEVILNAIFKSCIQIYGAPETFLTDNGGEFIGMAASINISVKVTVAESPFSNKLAERHNLIIADMMDKVLGVTTSQHGFNIGMVPRCQKLTSKSTSFVNIFACISTKPLITIYLHQHITSTDSTWYY